MNPGDSETKPSVLTLLLRRFRVWLHRCMSISIFLNVYHGQSVLGRAFPSSMVFLWSRSGMSLLPSMPLCLPGLHTVCNPQSIMGRCPLFPQLTLKSCSLAAGLSLLLSSQLLSSGPTWVTTTSYGQPYFCISLPDITLSSWLQGSHSKYKT